MKVLFIRHGESRSNRGDIVQNEKSAKIAKIRAKMCYNVLMKITKTSDQELSLDESATIQLIIGGFFAVFGIGALADSLLGLAIWNNQAPGGWSWIAGAVVGGIFAIIGILLVVFASKTHIALKNPGESTITKTRIFGGKAKSASFDAANVVGVKLITTTTRHRERDPDGDTHYETRRESRLSIVLRDTSEMVIASGGSTNTQSIGLGPVGLLNALNRSAVAPAPYAKEARAIADFFHVPLDAVDDGSVAANFANFASQATNGSANLAVMTASENTAIDHIREHQAMASARGQAENSAQAGANMSGVARSFGQNGAGVPNVEQNSAQAGANAGNVGANSAQNGASIPPVAQNFMQAAAIAPVFAQNNPAQAGVPTPNAGRNSADNDLNALNVARSPMGTEANARNIAQNPMDVEVNAPKSAQNFQQNGANIQNFSQNPAAALRNPDGSPADVPRGLSFRAPDAQSNAANLNANAPIASPDASQVSQNSAFSAPQALQNPTNPSFPAPQASAQNPNPSVPRENDYR